MANKPRKSGASAQFVSESNPNLNPKTSKETAEMTEQTNDLTLRDTKSASEIRDAAEMNEMLQGAEFDQHPELDVETPSQEAARRVFNVYRSELPASKGMIFAIHYYNPKHTSYVSPEEYAATGAKDPNVIRVYGNSSTGFYEGKNALEALSDFLRNKFQEVGDGYLRRQNGNLIVADWRLNEMRAVRGAKGVYVLDGLSDLPYRLIVPGKLNSAALWHEFKFLATSRNDEYGDSLVYVSAMNSAQVVYYETMMKLNAGYNLYFRKLDGRKLMPTKRYLAFKPETRERYFVGMSYFFHQPLVSTICKKIEDEREDAVVMKEAGAAISLKLRNNAIKAGVNTVLREAEQSGEKIEIVAGVDKLRLDPKFSAFSHPEWVETDANGAKWLDLSKVDVETRFSAFDIKSGKLLIALSKTLFFGDNADDKQANERTIAALKANAVSVYWRF